MSKDKIFSLKISDNGQGALKEQVHKHTTGERTKLKVAFALDSELRLVEPVTLQAGVFQEARELAGFGVSGLQEFLLDCKKENSPIFFPLTNLTYICEQTIVLEGQTVIKNTVNLFLPKTTDKSKLICSDVTVVFPRQNRNSLAESYLDYSMSRV